MTKDNLSKSITLIGPSCVGKSLLASELSKRNGMPVICVDDLISLVEAEMSGCISPSPAKQNKYKAKVLEEIRRDPEKRVLLTDKRYKEKEHALIQDFVDLYNGYNQLFGTLKPFYDTVYKIYVSRECFQNPIEQIFALNKTATDILDKALAVVDEPVILDMPGSFGWIMDPNLVKASSRLTLKNSPLDVKVEPLQKKMKNYCKETQTVLLAPGEDYAIRNAVKGHVANDLVAGCMENFYKSADVVITTNGLFNEPENMWFSQREWFDAREIDTKERLKNKGEISNVCDEVVFCLSELQASKELGDN